MEIQKTAAVSAVALDTNQPPKDFARLQLGTVLNAVVASLAENDTYILKLGDGRMIRAQTQNELTPGQLLKLEVVKPGAVPELKILWPEQPAQTNTQTLQNALRQLLPKQVDLKDFTTTLRQIAGTMPEKANPVSTAIQNTLGVLLAKDDLTSAEGVARAITNAGVFLEAKLAQQLSPQGDMKAQLLSLADALRKDLPNQDNEARVAANLVQAGNSGQTPELLAKTEGAIARIVLDQLASLPQANETQATWQISIPFTDGQHSDTANLKIKREDSHNPTQAPANWSLVLELDPPGLGPLRCKISLNGNKVDTYFWSDSEPGMAQVQDNLTLLAQRYSAAGLAVGHLDVVDAARMATATEKVNLPTLLDELA